MTKKAIFMRAMSMGLVVSVIGYQGGLGSIVAGAVSTARAASISAVKQEVDLELPEQVVLQKEDKATLYKAKSIAARSGDEAREAISDIQSKTAYKEAVSEILGMYYTDTSVSPEVEGFVDGLKPCAKEVVQNYEEAYEERCAADTLSYNTDKVIVQFEDNVSDESIEEAMDTLSDGGEVINEQQIDSSLPKDKQDRIRKAAKYKQYKTAVIDLGEDQSTSRAIGQYKDLDGVYTAERDSVQELDATGVTSNDPDSSKQWSMWQTNMKQTWNLIKKYRQYTNQVWAAVIDTGIDMDHPDLEDQILKQYSVDITQSSYPRLDTLTQQYLSDHGTHVAGILSARANNSIGIAGVAGICDSQNDRYLSCKIMAIQAFSIISGEVKMYISDEIKAINYAVDHGAEVINISAGGTSYSSACESAINYAYQAGVTVVAAAGNERVNTAHYPSDYNHVISVIATDQSNQKAYFSNYGSNTDISAPGANIYSTIVDGEYESKNGTSMASPFVAGVVALMREADYTLTPDEIERIIKNTAVDIGDTGWDEKTAFGLINPYDSVQSALSRYK